MKTFPIFAAVVFAVIVGLFGPLSSDLSARGRPTRSIDGVCGQANRTTVSSAPTTNLCSQGNPTAVLGSGPWTWTCQGVRGGVTANCSANKTSAAQSKTLSIQGQSNTVIANTSISTTSGPCIIIDSSTNITIKNVNIGPCGTNDTDADSQGIFIRNGSSVNVYDSIIHVENKSHTCGYSHNNIMILNNRAGPVNIQGNIIAYGESNISLWDSSNVSVIGNFLLNPRGSMTCGSPDNLQGNHFHAWADDATPNTNITASSNYILSAPTGFLYPAATSDYLGFGVTNTAVAQNNWISGTDGSNTNQNGCGLIADYKTNGATFTGNVISETYHCGLGIGSGSNHVISNNKVIIKNGNATSSGMGATNYYSGIPCGNISFTSNLAYAHQSTPYVQGYYADNSCSSVTLSSNTFDDGCTAGSNCAAYAAMEPIATTNPPPLIPPLPKNCVAKSIYATQTSMAPCP